MRTAVSLTLALTAVLAAGACSRKSETGSTTAASPSASAGAPVAPAAATPPAASSIAAAAMLRTAAPAGAKVYFVGIRSGDSLTSPFKLTFGVDGLKVAPAGTAEAGTGHHHLIIDSDLPPQDAPLPANEHVKHFGKGQTETELTLPAGTHTLQLEFADLNHLPFDPPVVSERVTITIK